ncbi:MYND finger [Nesidiocoris tenuis]|uniref:MYND finger n=1 Tax=Nesidiocoris tenuis TaxID=355587 RepID=A0ABN7AKD5_9HEMI|nr:MYND finger [Nesidiocoris tenuis]
MGSKEIHESLCLVCTQPASSRCSSCRAASYCSKEHQKQHWKTHKNQCIPYQVKEDKKLGRFLVASRDIQRGDVILKEHPLLSGPPHSTGPVCLGCNVLLTSVETSVPCPRCGWPLCSLPCADNPLHKPECEWAIEKKKDKVRISQFATPHPTYALITPIRALFLKEQDPTSWERLSGLESHCEQRKLDKKYEQDRFAVASALRRFYKLENEFSEEEIVRICGIIQINGHEVPLSEPAYISVYWVCSLLEHSCLPNCSKTFTDSGQVLIRAAVDIPKGSHISISYTDPLWSTPARRQHLILTKYFSCCCLRCVDPTENGSYFSGVRCPAKKCGGIVLPKCFIKDYETYACLKCGQKMTAKQAAGICSKVAQELLSLKKGDVASYTTALHRVKNLVGENYCQVVEAKLTLAQMIGQSTAKGLAEVDDDTLSMKENLCRQLISLSDGLFRAENRIRGVLFFELHAAVAEHARRLVNKKSSNAFVLQAQLLESGGYLERVLFFLKYEPKVLPEGIIYDQAVENLKDLQKLYQTMGITSPTT